MNNDEPWYDEVRDARQAIERVYPQGSRAALADCLPTERSFWERLAGPLAERMLQTQDVAVQSLGHPDPKVRMVALRVVSFYWGVKPGDESVRVCEQMALGERDSEVRSAALTALGVCYERTDDVRIGRLLATIVNDDREAPISRLGAYQALFAVRGLTQPLWPGALAQPPTLPRVPEDIDWSFVESFLAEERIAEPAPTALDIVLSRLRDPDRTAVRLFHEGCDAYERAGYAQSIDFFTRSITASDKLGGVYIVRGGAYMKLGQIDKAIADFSKAIELIPRSRRAYRSRALAYRSTGLDDRAEADDRMAEEIGSEFQIP